MVNPAEEAGQDSGFTKNPLLLGANKPYVEGHSHMTPNLSYELSMRTSCIIFRRAGQDLDGVEGDPKP